MCPEPGWVVGARTVSDREVATERTRMYLQRVLAVTTHPGSPLENTVRQQWCINYVGDKPDRFFVTGLLAGAERVTGKHLLDTGVDIGPGFLIGFLVANPAHRYTFPDHTL